ncbi:MAG: toll/interleukin-1 receptor domain-containing protein [Prochloraceae cyanobacterium]
MSLLDVIEVDCNGQIRRIELHKGDLTNLTSDDAVDILIVSAFPNDYTTTSTSLIGALFRKGISVKALSHEKLVDLRSAFSCWLSQPIIATNPGIQFRKILCFEPLFRGEPPDVVGDIFRALSPFLGDDPPIRTAAMPIVAAGDQGYPIQTMLRPLIEAAVNWMGIGLPLEILKIFAHSDQNAHQAATEFAKLKLKYTPQKRSVGGFKYDVFVSYSHKNASPAEAIAKHLQQNDLKIYIDVQSLQKGAAWQPHIFEALDDCAKMVALYSPAYIESKVCQEEFNIAWTRSREEDTQIIYPIYWQSAHLPTYMKMLNFVDCREAQNDKLPEACADLLTSLKQ